MDWIGFGNLWSSNGLKYTIIQVGGVESIEIAIRTIFDPINFLLVVLGVVLGLLLGILPGLGGVITIALLIPLTFGMDPLVAFMLLTAALAGTNFGGSITSILINTPGSAPNAATLLDGYPMSRDGRAGEAIGASAASSALGAFFGIFVLVITIPIMLNFVLLFSPPEIFWLGVWGLTVIAVVVNGSVITGLISACAGFLFALHGINQMTATVRWDYGLSFLRDGMPLVPALIGLFAVAEMIKLVSEGGSIDNSNNTKVGGGQWKGAMSVIKNKWLFARSASVGAIIGVIPGVGGAAANYIAYFQATQSSSNSDSYGNGDIRGVIAPEASNDAKDGTGFLPTLGLGVPGSASMAVLLGAFVLHGITPGPGLFVENLDIVSTIIIALLIGNIISSLIGMAFADKLVYVTQIDTRILAPFVLAIAFFGSFAISGNIYMVFITMFFGLLGFAMIKVDMSRIPMVLALVLAPIVEENLFRSLQISDGDIGIFIRSTLTILLISLVILSLASPLIRPFINKKFLGGA